MPQYMLLLGGVPHPKKPARDPNYAVVAQKYQEWTMQLIQSGMLRGANKLKDEQGRRLVFSNNQIVDGPFTETKETVGGYYIIEAVGYDQALDVARNCPVVTHQQGLVEIREIENMEKKS